jgi:hypothetical protein
MPELIKIVLNLQIIVVRKTHRGNHAFASDFVDTANIYPNSELFVAGETQLLSFAFYSL